MNKNWFVTKLVKENALYFSLFALFFVVGGIILLLIDRGDAIFFFSDRRQPFWNFFFFYFTKMAEEWVILSIFFVLLFIKYRFALFLTVLAFMVTFTSFITKIIFAHDRPLLFFTKMGIIDQINVIENVVLNGGANSFPSGHTMAAFALYSYLAFCTSSKRIVAALLFAIALLVGISRIYLVQHFLEDVYLGAIIGLLLAILTYYLQNRLTQNPNHWANKSLRDLFRRNNKKTNPQGFQKP